MYLNDGRLLHRYPDAPETLANAIVDDCLWDVATMDDDMLGLDHPDRSLNRRNGLGDLFLR